MSGFGDGLVTQTNGGTGTMVADAVQYRVAQVVPTLMLDMEDYLGVGLRFLYFKPTIALRMQPTTRAQPVGHPRRSQ